MQRILLIVGIVLLAVAGLWKFVISPQNNQRFPDGWVWDMNTLGRSFWADAEVGQFPEGTTLADDPVSLTTRIVTAEADGAPAGQVIITDDFETRNAETNVVEWEYTVTAVVDPVTGQHSEGELAGDYYFMPRDAQQQTYFISHSAYVHLPMTFQREEQVAGLNTYVYGYKGDLENEISYASYTEFADNEDVYCFDFQMDFWVEPTTGELVKYYEWCEGDWVVDNVSDERLRALQRWGNETTGDDLIRRAGIIQGQVNSARLNNLYIPGLLAVLGVLALAVALIPGMMKPQAPDKKVTA